MWNKFLHNPFHIVKDYELRKLLWQSGSGTAVCKKYLKFRDTAPEKLTFPETQVDEPIWLFWNTGLEQAPEIVKTCYQSIKKYAGRQVVLLTENNVQNYINMPDYLNEKLKSGVLPLAIYTDLMRVALLEHYGGTWMDLWHTDFMIVVAVKNSCMWFMELIMQRTIEKIRKDMRT